MHLFSPVMSSRSHLWLRLGALALLATLLVMPRGMRGGANVTAAELARGAHDTTPTHAVAARAETTAAKLVSPPRTTKLVVAEADESALNN